MTSDLEQARAFFGNGIEHFESGRLEQARASFESALALAPDRASVLGNLGVTLYHLGQVEHAVPLLQRATAGDPTFLDAWVCLGLALERLGQWQAAADALGRALALSPAQALLWFRRGQCLMRLGQLQQALQAFGRALEADPGYGDAWSAQGGVLRDLQRLPEAAASFEKAIACGADPELNRYYLASVSGQSLQVQAPPRRYVEALFDDYAPEFQNHVVGALGYQGYERLLQPLVEQGRRYQRALDLGCGTGLCAPLLQRLAETVDGVDLSTAMVEQARATGVYRRLVHADVVDFLRDEREPADLIAAADVFIYVGELQPVFDAARRVLAPDGMFAFTVELAGPGEALQLLPSLRYAHSESYVRQRAAECGLQVRQMFQAPVRIDQGRPLEGLYCYLAPAGAA